MPSSPSSWTDLPVERLTELPWHEVARWNATRARWLRRGAWAGALLAALGIVLCVQNADGSTAWRAALSVSLLAPGAALAALGAHLFARAYERATPHPLDDLL